MKLPDESLYANDIIHNAMRRTTSNTRSLFSKGSASRAVASETRLGLRSDHLSCRSNVIRRLEEGNAQQWRESGDQQMNLPALLRRENFAPVVLQRRRTLLHQVRYWIRWFLLQANLLQHGHRSKIPRARCGRLDQALHQRLAFSGSQPVASLV